VVLQWVAANTLGCAVARWIVLRAVRFPYNYGSDQTCWPGIAQCVPVGIACGAIIGIAQWTVLRRTLRLSPSWILGACLTSVVSDLHFRLVDNLSSFVMLVAATALAAVVQVWILRGHVRRTALWPVAAVLSCLAGWFAGMWVGFSWVRDMDAVDFLAGGAAGGCAAGLASAPLLALMLRRRITAAEC
jgi:hypothetical protein